MKPQIEACYAVLHVGTGPSKLAEQKAPSRLIVRDGEARFELGDDIWIERFDQQISKNIQKACEPPHYRMDDMGYDRHLYGFVRRVPAHEKTRFEGMSELQSLAFHA